VTTAAEAPRWRRLEPDARRGQILDCAVRLFGERPYAAVSTTDIAREAGVARGLLNHYFGTKRDLYLEVVRTIVLLPDLAGAAATSGPLKKRVQANVDWFLDTVSVHAKTFVVVTGAEGVGDDPEIERILADADDAAARKVLVTLGLSAEVDQHRAVIRAYGGLVKAAIREWIRNETLTRQQVHLLLSQALITIAKDVLPEMD
jgi:AcrR family transcriptional regulator